MSEPPPPGHLVSRQVCGLVEQCVQDFRVTVVNGPRQAGKTTLLRQLHAKLGGTFVTFDDAGTRAAARSDPEASSKPVPGRCSSTRCNAPGDDFVLAVKAAVDREQRPGTFVLSGSTRFLTVPTLSESLAGRVALVELWPFSVAERVGARHDFKPRVRRPWRPAAPATRLVAEPHSQGEATAQAGEIPSTCPGARRPHQTRTAGHASHQSSKCRPLAQWTESRRNAASTQRDTHITHLG